jgi:hypothetical protein
MKLIVTLPFMQHKGSLRFSKEPTTEPYPEPIKSNPNLHTVFIIIHFTVLCIPPLYT